MNTHHAFAPRMPRPLNIAARFAAFATLTVSAAFAASPGASAPLVPVIDRLAGFVNVEAANTLPDVSPEKRDIRLPELSGVEKPAQLRASWVLPLPELPDFAPNVVLPGAGALPQEPLRVALSDIASPGSVLKIENTLPDFLLLGQTPSALFNPKAVAMPLPPPSSGLASLPEREAAYAAWLRAPGHIADSALGFRNTIGLPNLNLSDDEAATLLSNIVLSGLLDGSLNSSNPEWRPHLAHLLENPKTKDADTVFSLLLAACADNTDMVKMMRALEWAEAHESGRFFGIIRYFCARRHFLNGDYEQALSFCVLIERDNPAHTVKAMLLRALTLAHKGDTKGAHAVLTAIDTDYPESDEIPEVRYMEAWLALQDMREDEAKTILKAIITNHPRTSAAWRADRILKSLEAYQ